MTHPSDPCPVREDGSLDVELRGMPGWQVVAYKSESENPGWWCLWVMYEGPDRDTGEPGEFASRFYAKRRDGGHPTVRKAANWAKRAVLSMMAHELHEALHAGGLRVLDPHWRHNGGA